MQGEPEPVGVVAADEAPGSSAPTRERLQFRLRFLCVLGFGGYLLFGCVVASGWDPVLNWSTLGPGCLVLLTVTTVAPVVCGVILLIRSDLALVSIRTIEYVLVGLNVVTLAAIRYSALGYALGVAGTDVDPGSTGPLYAIAISNLTLLCVVGVFGVLVPNHWSRTLSTALGLIGTSLLAEAVCRLTTDGAGHDHLLSSMTLTGLTLFIGTGVAIFGSYSISTLRGRVVEAEQLLRRLGQYELVRLLDKGGMGEVYLAEHALMKRVCAIKLVRNDRAGDPTFVKRFEREVGAVTRLSHPAIVEIYDYGRRADGTLYYVMEYLPGLTLQRILAKHEPMSVARAIHVIRQLCGALHAAHASGLVHRDVKPSNVMLCHFPDRSDVAKLLDFGLVTNSSGDGGNTLTDPGAILGTADYMSPEQAAGRTRVDERADLYSLGATAYAMLTGHPPFPRDSVLATVHAHVSAPVPSAASERPDVPPDLDVIVRRLMAKAPDDRFATALEVDEALRSCEHAEAWTDGDARDWWQTAETVVLATRDEPASAEPTPA